MNAVIGLSQFSTNAVVFNPTQAEKGRKRHCPRPITNDGRMRAPRVQPKVIKRLTRTAVDLVFPEVS